MATGNSNRTNIIIALIGLAGIALTVGLPLYCNRDKPKDEAPKKTIAYIDYEGVVKNGTTGEPVPDAEVSFKDKPTMAPIHTDSRGVFSFKVEAPEGEQTIRLQVRHKNFISWNNYRKLTSQPRVEEIILDPLAVKKDDANLVNPTDKKMIRAFKQQNISGYVTDAAGNRLANVEVSVEGDINKEMTNSSGAFVLKTSSNAYAVRVQANKAGYAPWNDYVRANRNDLVIVLTPGK